MPPVPRSISFAELPNRRGPIGVIAMLCVPVTTPAAFCAVTVMT